MSQMPFWPFLGSDQPGLALSHKNPPKTQILAGKFAPNFGHFPQKSTKISPKSGFWPNFGGFLWDNANFAPKSAKPRNYPRPIRAFLKKKCRILPAVFLLFTGFFLLFNDLLGVKFTYIPASQAQTPKIDIPIGKNIPEMPKNGHFGQFCPVSGKTGIVPRKSTAKRDFRDFPPRSDFLAGSTCGNFARF